MGLNYQQVLKNVPMGAGGPETCYGEILSVKVNCEPWAMGGHGSWVMEWVMFGQFHFQVEWVPWVSS